MSTPTRSPIPPLLALLLTATFLPAIAATSPVTTNTPAVSPSTVKERAPASARNQSGPGPIAPPAAASAKPVQPAARTAPTAIEPAPVVSQQPEVVVTAATRNAQSPDTTATSTTVATHDDIVNQKFPDVVTALSLQPGITVAQSGTPGQVTSVFTRGTNSDQTLLTIDGRRQAPDFTNFYDFSNLTFDNVDQLEVVRTPSSVLQGGNAVGGVINLSTLSGRGVTPEGSVAFEAGSFDTFRTIDQSRGAIGDFDYSVAFSRQDSHFPRDNNDYTNNVYRGNYGYQVAPTVYIDLQTSYTVSDAGSPSSLAFPDPTADLYRETWNISPRITVQATDFYTSTLYYNQTQQRQVYSDYFFFAHNRSQVDANSIDWQNDFQIARRWKLTAGIQGDSTNISDFDDLAGKRDIQNSLANIGGYALSQWEPLPGLTVLTSLRYDHYSDFEGAFSWRQGLSYLVAETGTVLHGSVASSYSTPSVDELYYPGFFGIAVGNPDLMPESSLGWEIGAKQPFFDGRLTASATYFHNKIDDLIISQPPLYSPVNIDSGTTQGAELGLDVQPCEWLRVNVNYTYLSAYDDNTGVQLPLRPRNSTNFTVIYTPIDPVTLTAGGSWVVGRQYSANVDAEDYFVLRLTGTWRINPHVSIWARGENVLDESYQQVAGFPNLGAAAYGGVKFSF